MSTIIKHRIKFEHMLELNRETDERKELEKGGTKERPLLQLRISNWEVPIMFIC